MRSDFLILVELGEEAPPVKHIGCSLERNNHKENVVFLKFSVVNNRLDDGVIRYVVA